MTAQLGARRERGFTLTELAVVFLIVSIMLATAMYTLSAQTEQRNFEETRRRLEVARELLLGFAVANGRLPCPGTTSGDEAPAGGGTCTANFSNGFLPARTLGFPVVDGNGYALDAWQGPIRYVVSVAAPTACAASSTAPHFTNATNLRTNGITCRPNDLVVCNRSPVTVTNTVCDANTAVTNQQVVVAVVLSTGKNRSTTGGAGTNEARNLDNNPLFVSRPPDAPNAVNGEFDDQMAWIAVGELYGRLISAGVLP